MQKAVARIMVLACNMALVFCLNACGDSKYLTIKDGVATVASLKDIGDSRKRNEVYADIVQKLQKTKEPFHTLVLEGNMVVSALPHFVPVADNITELIIRGDCAPPYQLAEYKNLRRLQITSLFFMNSGEVAKFVDCLQACSSLRELSILKPAGPDYYAFAKSLQARAFLTTVNGQTLASWNPAKELRDDESTYYFTLGVLSDTFESEIKAYTPSATTPPPLQGRIIVGTQEDAKPIEFKEAYEPGLGLENFGKKYFAPTLDACVAVIVLQSSYEQSGVYFDGTKGYRGHFSVRVFDPVNKVVYTPVALTSKDPTQNIGRGTGGNIVSGNPRPVVDRAELRAYVKTLVNPE